MERYRKVRPAPEPTTHQWTQKAADVGEELLRREADPQPSSQSPEMSQPSRRPAAYKREPVPAEARLCSFQAPALQPENARTLSIGLAGAPNAGKSSLLNALLACPVSSVSPKVNTTRDGVRGILTSEEVQLAFLDNPGIVPSHQRRENKELVARAWRGYTECDLCLLVVDVVKRPTQEIFDVVRQIAPIEDLGIAEIRHRTRAFKDVADEDMPGAWLPRRIPGTTSPMGRETAREGRTPVVLVLNKIDKAPEFRWVLSRAKEFGDHGHFDAIFFISALKEQGLEKLLEHLKDRAKPGAWQYPPELRTTLSYVDQLKHQIDTHLFKWFNSDVPYKVRQQTVGWTPRLDGSLVIEHELIVDDSVVARMLCGVRNQIVLRLRDQVSYKLTKQWGTKVEVRIWVNALKTRLSIRDRQGTSNVAA